MKTKAPKAIRLTRTPEVDRALKEARRQFPTLNNPELFKLALSRLVYPPNTEVEEVAEIRAMTARAFGAHYLSDPAEDIYHLGMGKKVNFGRKR